MFQAERSFVVPYVALSPVQTLPAATPHRCSRTGRVPCRFSCAATGGRGMISAMFKWWRSLWRVGREAPPSTPSAPPAQLREDRCFFDVIDVPRVFHLGSLPRYLARLQRLRELQAPESILEAELNLIQGAISHLAPEEVLAVFGNWQDLAPYSSLQVWIDDRVFHQLSVQTYREEDGGTTGK